MKCVRISQWQTKSTRETVKDKQIFKVNSHVELSLKRGREGETGERKREKSEKKNETSVGKELCDLLVIFENHIGVISDKKNKKGIPFLIHHANPLQVQYEEDVLELYGQDSIIGHYRIS